MICPSTPSPSSPPTPRRIRGRSRSLRPGLAPRCISPASCSRRWPASTSSTCPIAVQRRASDVMSGQIHGMFDNVTSSFELVRSGKLRALGVTTRERSEILPEVPPIADTLSGYETSSFYGIGAPHDTPRDIVDLLNKEINAALADPAIRQRIAELGAIAITARCLRARPSAGARSWRCPGSRRNRLSSRLARKA